MPARTRRPSDGQVLLMVGTLKGAFIFTSGEKRSRWTMHGGGPHFSGESVYALAYDERGGRRRLLASTRSFHWGSTIRTSDNFGATWSGPERQTVRFPESSGLSLVQVWQIKPGPADRAGSALGRRRADGAIRVARRRRQLEPRRRLVGARASSAVDAGRGRYVPAHDRARPEELGSHTDRDVDGRRLSHGRRRQIMARAKRGRARAVSAEQVSRVRPMRAQGRAPPGASRAALPPEPLGPLSQRRLGRQLDGRGERRARPTSASRCRCIRTIPTPSTSCRSNPTSSAARRRPSLRVYRTRDAGGTWQPLANGLPQKDAYETVVRDAMSADSHDPAGIYFGTRSGKVFASADGGDSWARVADSLPPVVCVRAAVVGAAGASTAA